MGPFWSHDDLSKEIDVNKLLLIGAAASAVLQSLRVISSASSGCTHAMAFHMRKPRQVASFQTCRVRGTVYIHRVAEPFHQPHMTGQM
jgi:hypothetical protein